MRTPLPPADLRERTGATPAGSDPERHYEDQGAQQRTRVEELLGPTWSWNGKRVLDFGCGAGRGLRHFRDLAEGGGCEVWGCDISEPSVRWLQANLCPPLRVFRNHESPPLGVLSDHFDAVWALSVFTHISRNWADWLLELRRILKPDGRLIATFLNEGMRPLWSELTSEPWAPEAVGMRVFRRRAPWDEGGSIVFLSESWLRGRWGCAFEIEQLASKNFGPGGQGYVVCRPRPGPLTADYLRRPEPGDPTTRRAWLGAKLGRSR